jgi:hypothetical protein
MNGCCCEVCGELAWVHVTEIRDGQAVERSFCDKHADLGGIPGLSVGAGGRMVVNGVMCPTIRELGSAKLFAGWRTSRGIQISFI